MSSQSFCFSRDSTSRHSIACHSIMMHHGTATSAGLLTDSSPTLQAIISAVQSTTAHLTMKIIDEKRAAQPPRLPYNPNQTMHMQGMVGAPGSMPGGVLTPGTIPNTMPAVAGHLTPGRSLHPPVPWTLSRSYDYPQWYICARLNADGFNARSSRTDGANARCSSQLTPSSYP